MIEGKFGISAKVLCDSISEDGVRLTTFELTYPRLILSELNTHGALARNSASSRAIPFTKMAESLTARPVRFGQANPGMQDKGVSYSEKILGIYTPEEWWQAACKNAQNYAQGLYDAGYHKQVFNRLTEPFQMMKTVLSATEFENFFWLRDDGAADPTIHELACCMKQARAPSEPQLLKPGQWHLPYVNYFLTRDGEQQCFIDNGEGDEIYLTLEEAIKVSCARAAAVSFRNTDYGLEKCIEVYARLVGDERKHASAMEHQATPVKSLKPGLWSRLTGSCWEPGASHIDKDGCLWSGKFRGFIQHRKTIPGENKAG